MALCSAKWIKWLGPVRKTRRTYGSPEKSQSGSASPQKWVRSKTRAEISRLNMLISGPFRKGGNIEKCPSFSLVSQLQGRNSQIVWLILKVTSRGASAQAFGLQGGAINFGCGTACNSGTSVESGTFHRNCRSWNFPKRINIKFAEVDFFF